MKRFVAFFVCVILSGAASAAESKDRLAFIDSRTLDAAIRPQLDAYDREIAALKATESVPQLSDTRGIVRRQADVVKAGAAEARNTLAALRTMPVQPPKDGYRNALSSETATSLASFRAGLQARVNGAYAARRQEFYEHESELDMRLQRASADRRLALVVRLQNLKPPFADRKQLRAQIAAIDGNIARQVDSLRSSDQQQLAAYKSQLDAQASNDDVSMQNEMLHKAQANLALHQHVVAQTVNVSGTDKGLQQAKFDAAGDDISHRFTQIADADDAARGTASNQIIALQRNKAALIEEFRRSARDLAASLARQRGLTLVDHPVPGGTDLTPQVVTTLTAR